MGEIKWAFNLFGIRIGWYKHFSAVCYDRRNQLLQIGKLELWFYGSNKTEEDNDKKTKSNMEITKETQHKAIAALRQCAKENENKPADTGAVRVTDLCRDVADYLEKLAADEHPKQSWWRPVTEWPKDKEPILMKLSNGKYQYTEWVDDGKGFDSGFAEINFGGGAMVRLPVEYDVVAWRPLADVINEYVNHGVVAPLFDRQVNE